MFWGNCAHVLGQILYECMKYACRPIGASMHVLGCSYWGKNAVIGARMHVHSSYQKHCDLGHVYPAMYNHHCMLSCTTCQI